MTSLDGRSDAKGIERWSIERLGESGALVGFTMPGVTGYRFSCTGAIAVAWYSPVRRAEITAEVERIVL
jgi:hypothetical protein